MPNAFDFCASPFDCLDTEEQQIVRRSMDIACFRDGATLLDPSVEPLHLFVVIKGRNPPHLPSTRRGRIFAPWAMPATPVALLVSAAIVPATCVPCQLDDVCPDPSHSPGAAHSPGSCESSSRPVPSLEVAISAMKS